MWFTDKICCRFACYCCYIVSVIINIDNIIVIIVAFDINIIIVVFVTSSFLDQEKCLSAKL
jgi:hypothetical protein